MLFFQNNQSARIQFILLARYNEFRICKIEKETIEISTLELLLLS